VVNADCLPYEFIRILTANTDRDCLELQAADLTLSSNDSGGSFTSLFVPREPSSGESNSLEFDGPP